MRMIAVLAALLASLSVTLPAVAAPSAQERAISARQSAMTLRAFNLGPLIAMIKGEIPYDAEQANRFAGNLNTMLDLHMGDAWMEGTSTKDYPEKSEALPAVWAADSKLGEHGNDYAQAVQELAAVAGEGRAALAPAAKKVAQSCKSCHDDYREKR